MQVGNADKQFIFDCREVKIKDVITPIKDKLWIGHNIKFDIKHIKLATGIIPKKVWCTMTVDKCLHNGMYDGYALNDLSKRYLNFDYDSKQLNLFEPHISKKLRKQFLTITTEPISEAQYAYAKWDVIIPHKLYEMFKDQDNALIKFENEYLIVSAVMEMQGVSIDTKKWLEITSEREAELIDLLEELNGINEIN